jgi:predicted nucleic acid-binding protein
VGSLNLPASGKVYLDAAPIIYSVETHPKYFPLLAPAWQTAHSRQTPFLTSELSLLEVLVAPLRAKDAKILAAYEGVLASSDIQLIPITMEVLREAAQLRASIASLRTPDAIHAASALLAGCSMFICNDAGFKRVPNLPVAILDDVLA